MCVFAAGATGLFGLGAGASNLFLASLGLNLATGLAGRSAAQAAAQQTYQAAVVGSQSADQALAAQQEGLAAQLKETQASKQQEKLAATIRGLQARGSALASERAGVTFNVLLQDQERQAANARESINQSLESARRQYGRNIQGLTAQRDSRRNRLQSSVNQAFNEIEPLGSVLLNTAVQGLSSYASLTG
tara:strand:+ start:3927 stop:4496 length:570 start_codon:yes stop_codon:yes gene_type:complete